MENSSKHEDDRSNEHEDDRSNDVYAFGQWCADLAVGLEQRRQRLCGSQLSKDLSPYEKHSEHDDHECERHYECL